MVSWSLLTCRCPAVKCLGAQGRPDGHRPLRYRCHFLCTEIAAFIQYISRPMPNIGPYTAPFGQFKSGRARQARDNPVETLPIGPRAELQNSLLQNGPGQFCTTQIGLRDQIRHRDSAGLPMRIEPYSQDRQHRCGRFRECKASRMP